MDQSESFLLSHDVQTIHDVCPYLCFCKTKIFRELKFQKQRHCVSNIYCETCISQAAPCCKMGFYPCGFKRQDASMTEHNRIYKIHTQTKGITDVHAQCGCIATCQRTLPKVQEMQLYLLLGIQRHIEVPGCVNF